MRRTVMVVVLVSLISGISFADVKECDVATEIMCSISDEGEPVGMTPESNVELQKLVMHPWEFAARLLALMLFRA